MDSRKKVKASDGLNGGGGSAMDDDDDVFGGGGRVGAKGWRCSFLRGASPAKLLAKDPFPRLAQLRFVGLRSSLSSCRRFLIEDFPRQREESGREPVTGSGFL